MSKKTATAGDVIRWTADHLLDPKVRETDAPSKAAWNMLLYARDHEAEFWRVQYTKLTSMNQEDELERRRRRDTNLKETIQRLRKVSETIRLRSAQNTLGSTDAISLLQARAEGASSEPAVEGDAP